MSFNFTIKQWDSDFFGYPVALIGGDGQLADFQNLVSSMRLEKVKLAYWFFDQNEKDKKEIADQFNGIALHNRLTHQFDTENKSVENFKSNHIEFLKTWDDTLFQLILECGNFSRFKVDKTFGEEVYIKLYRRWTEEMLAKHIVFAFKEGEKIKGCVVLEIKNNKAALHFLAVDISARNSGIGKQITRAAIDIAADQKCESIIVYTHRINTPIWKLFEAEGFQFIKEESVYHFWL